MPVNFNLNVSSLSHSKWSMPVFIVCQVSQKWLLWNGISLLGFKLEIYRISISAENNRTIAAAKLIIGILPAKPDALCTSEYSAKETTSMICMVYTIHSRGAYSSAWNYCTLFNNPNSHRTVESLVMTCSENGRDLFQANLNSLLFDKFRGLWTRE